MNFEFDIKRKKADLPNEVLSIIIAAIGLSILVFASFKIYQLGTNTESKNAQNTLDNIVSKIEALKEGESNTFNIQGFSGASSWQITAWNEDDKIKPEKCLFGTCICISKYSSGDYQFAPYIMDKYDLSVASNMPLEVLKTALRTFISQDPLASAISLKDLVSFMDDEYFPYGVPKTGDLRKIEIQYNPDSDNKIGGYDGPKVGLINLSDEALSVQNSGFCRQVSSLDNIFVSSRLDVYAHAQDKKINGVYLWNPTIHLKSNLLLIKISILRTNGGKLSAALNGLDKVSLP